MRIIKPSRVREFAAAHPDAAEALERWLAIARRAQWSSLVRVRQSFPSADEVGAESGRKVVIFNIRGNSYRLTTAIHYDMGKVFMMRFLTHAEYTKDR